MRKVEYQTRRHGVEFTFQLMYLRREKGELSFPF